MRVTLTAYWNCSISVVHSLRHIAFIVFLAQVFCRKEAKTITAKCAGEAKDGGSLLQPHATLLLSFSSQVRISMAVTFIQLDGNKVEQVDAIFSDDI